MTSQRLTDDDYAVLKAEVLRMDPDGDVVSLDLVANTLQYASDIKCHESITALAGEEIVRAYVVTWLVTVGGYPTSRLELEKRYSYGRNGQGELDIRIAQLEGDTAYALIEIKQPHEYRGETDPVINGQLFAYAGTEADTQVVSLMTVGINAERAPFVRSVTIDFVAHSHFDAWVAAKRPHREDFPTNYDRAVVEPYAKGSDNDLSKGLSASILDNRRKVLHNRLWGGGNDDNLIYGWLVKFFLSKIHDEQSTEDGEEYKVQVLHVNSRKEPARTTVERLDVVWQEAYRKFLNPETTNQASPSVRHPNQSAGTLGGGLFSDADIAWVVETMQSISLTSAGKASGDLLGGFFEAITREGFKQSKGLFFTHFNIAAFMVEAMNLRQMAEEYLRDTSKATGNRLPYIMDPSAGSGTFLLAAMHAVTSHLGEKRASLGSNDDRRKELNRWLPTENPNQWASTFLYGIEKREDLAVSTKVNMVLHQDGSTHVYNDDAISPLADIAKRHGEPKLNSSALASDAYYSKHVSETMDAIITNPPFSVSLDGEVLNTLAATFELAGESNSENLFVERWYQLLKPGGRLAAVMPESTFSTAENARVRRFIMAHFNIRAIVALPPHAFQPWTPTRTSILLAQKKSPEEETAWAAVYKPAAASMNAASREAAKKLARVKKPLRNDGESKTLEVAHELVDLMATLGVIAPALASAGDAEPWTKEVATQLASVDPEHIAFAKAVEVTMPGAGYVGLAVSDIGYKRTKRGESNRRNDLFVGKDTQGEALRNLNDYPVGWTLEVTDDGTDALSVLRKANLWS
ncbi:type I restriction enzyme M protein [Arthrobacter sp. ov407]|uniref:restriction endonuclease subunit M n=1 Tax=Arthrobacter sp. ov407 TaxID=1761748 RepID=UPI000884A0E3|nr:N-6 DNA methylase [Arthrobacter sp. ov407]SDM03014.1 type I restriction enzyme M protein [Arthrobacter sp. ov407]